GGGAAGGGGGGGGGSDVDMAGTVGNDMTGLVVDMATPLDLRLPNDLVTPNDLEPLPCAVSCNGTGCCTGGGTPTCTTPTPTVGCATDGTTCTPCPAGKADNCAGG